MANLSVLGVTEDSRFLAGGRLAFIKLMKALAVVGNDVIVLASSGATEGVVDPKPARVVRFATTNARFIGPIMFLFKLFFALPPYVARADVVVVNSGYTVYLVAALSKVMGKRVVVLQHDAHNLSYLQRIASNRSRRYTAIVRWILIYTPLKIVSGILCISDMTMTGLRNMGFNTPSYKVGNVVE